MLIWSAIVKVAPWTSGQAENITLSGTGGSMYFWSKEAIIFLWECGVAMFCTRNALVWLLNSIVVWRFYHQEMLITTLAPHMSQQKHPPLQCHLLNRQCWHCWNIFADACCYVLRQISGRCAFTFDGIASWIEYTTSILHHGSVLLSPGHS
jgi:hypothetical protein